MKATTKTRKRIYKHVVIEKKTSPSKASKLTIDKLTTFDTDGGKTGSGSASVQFVCTITKCHIEKAATIARLIAGDGVYRIRERTPSGVFNANGCQIIRIGEEKKREPKSVSVLKSPRKAK